MRLQWTMSRREFLIITGLAGGAGLLNACAPAPTPTPQPAVAATEVPATSAPAADATAIPPTATPAAIATLEPAEATAVAEAAMKATPPGDKKVVELLSVYGDVLTNDSQPHFVINRDYMNLHPDQYINYVPSSAFTGAFNEVLLTRIAGGDVPDLVMHWSSPVALAARGACTPMDDLMAAHTVANKDAFYEGPLKTCNWMGQQWGLTINASQSVYYGNTDMMQERGISTKREDFPTTWDGVREMSAKFTKWDGDTLVLAGTTPWYPDWSWPAQVEACGAKFFDGATNQYNIADERIADMLQYWLAWIDQEYKGDFGKLKEKHDMWEAHGPESSFGQGFQGLTVGGVWSLTALVDCPTIKYEIYKMPIGPGGTASKASAWPNFLFIPKGAKNIAEAFEVTAYYCTEGMVAWFDRWCDLPCWKKFPSDRAPLKLIQGVGRERALELVKFSLDYVSAVVEQWNSPIDDFAIDQINRAFDQVMRRVVAKPMDALAEAQKQCAAKLEEVMASV